MMAGYGIAVLFMNKKWFGKINFPLAGSRSVEDAGQDNKSRKYKTNASAFEVGAPHFPNIFALGAAVEFISGIGIDNISNRVFELNDHLEDKLKEKNMKILSPLDIKDRSGITCVEVEDPALIAEKLKNKQIIVTARKNFLRISPHFYNNFEDIDKFIDEFKLIKM